MKIHSSCEIEDFVETHLCKLCVILHYIWWMWGSNPRPKKPMVCRRRHTKPYDTYMRLPTLAWKNRLYRLPLKINYHVYIARSTYHYAYA